MTGKDITNKLKGKGYTITSAAKALGISRQALHTNLGKAVLDKDFLQSVKTKLNIDLTGNIDQSVTREDFMRDTKEEITALKATVKILTLKIIGLESKATKQPFEKISLELGEMIDKEAKRLLDVLRSES